MSQVDDWSDGYTSDYLRDLNTYGPASVNVPRPSSVVSRRVQYQPPVAQTGAQTEAKTNDTPLYDNDGGFNPGPQRLVSAPARSFRGNATAAQRAARPKPAVKKKTQSASKQQPQPEYRTGGARTPEENEITRSAAEHRAGADLGELSSQALDAAARFLPALKLLGFGAGAGSADTASTDRPSYMGAAGTMADNFARTLPQPSAASRQTVPESSSTEGQFKNMPWYKDAKAHHEAVKKNMDDYGSALGTLKSTWDDIPWWTKLVMLPPVFKAGSPAAGASTAGNVWAEGGRAAAGDAAAGTGAGSAAGAEGRSFGFDLSAEDVAAANAANAAARQQAVDLSEMRSTLMHAGMPDREIEAYMHGAGFYNDPEALRQALDVVSKYGMAGLFEHSAARAAAAARAGSAAGTGAGSAAGTGSRGSFGFDLSPEEIASAKASHDAYVRGTAGAADGGVSKLAEAGNVGRETAAGAATGSVSEGVDSASQQLIEHIRSGTLDEMERAWIEATAAGAAKAPGTIDASTQAILNEARAAGILGRDAAGTAGADAATGAAGTAGTGAGHVGLERAYVDALNNVLGTTTGRAATGAAGRTAADGGVSELANAANVGRGAAGADAAAGAAGTAGSGAIDSTTRFLIKQIKTGKLDELERAWVYALADRGARNPQLLSASEQALVDNARAAGILDDAAAGAARGVPQGTVAGAGSKARGGEIPDANGMTRSRADEVLAREEIRRYDPRMHEGIARYIEDDLKTLAGKPGYETPYQAFQTLTSQWGKYNPDLGQDPYNYIWRLAVRMFK